MEADSKKGPQVSKAGVKPEKNLTATVSKYKSSHEEFPLKSGPATTGKYSSSDDKHDSGHPSHEGTAVDANPLGGDVKPPWNPCTIVSYHDPFDALFEDDSKAMGLSNFKLRQRRILPPGRARVTRQRHELSPVQKTPRCSIISQGTSASQPFNLNRQSIREKSFHGLSGKGTKTPGAKTRKSPPHGISPHITLTGMNGVCGRRSRRGSYSTVDVTIKLNPDNLDCDQTHEEEMMLQISNSQRRTISCEELIQNNMAHLVASETKSLASADNSPTQSMQRLGVRDSLLAPDYSNDSSFEGFDSVSKRKTQEEIPSLGDSSLDKLKNNFSDTGEIQSPAFTEKLRETCGMTEPEEVLRESETFFQPFSEKKSENTSETTLSNQSMAQRNTPYPMESMPLNKSPIRDSQNTQNGINMLIIEQDGPEDTSTGENRPKSPCEETLPSPVECSVYNESKSFSSIQPPSKNNKCDHHGEANDTVSTTVSEKSDDGSENSNYKMEAFSTKEGREIKYPEEGAIQSNQVSLVGSKTTSVEMLSEQSKESSDVTKSGITMMELEEPQNESDYAASCSKEDNSQERLTETQTYSPDKNNIECLASEAASPFETAYKSKIQGYPSYPDIDCGQSGQFSTEVSISSKSKSLSTIEGFPDKDIEEACQAVTKPKEHSAESINLIEKLQYQNEGNYNTTNNNVVSKSKQEEQKTKPSLQNPEANSTDKISADEPDAITEKPLSTAAPLQKQERDAPNTLQESEWNQKELKDCSQCLEIEERTSNTFALCPDVTSDKQIHVSPNSSPTSKTEEQDSTRSDSNGHEFNHGNMRNNINLESPGMLEKRGPQKRQAIDSLCLDTSVDNPCQVIDEVSTVSNEEEKTESQELMEDSYNSVDNHSHLPSQKDPVGCLEGVKKGASENVHLFTQRNSEEARQRSAESFAVSNESINVSEQRDPEIRNLLIFEADGKIEAKEQTSLVSNSTVNTLHQCSDESSVASLNEFRTTEMLTQADDINNNSNSISNLGSEEIQRDTSNIITPCLDADMTKQLPNNVPSLRREIRAEDPQLSSSSVDSKIKKNVTPNSNKDTYGARDSNTTTTPKPDEQDNARSSEATSKKENQDPSSSCSDDPLPGESGSSLKETVLKMKQSIDDIHNLSNSLSNEASEDIQNEPCDSITHLKTEEVPNNFTSDEEPEQVPTETFADSEAIQQEELPQECKDFGRKESGLISDESFGVEELSDQNKSGSHSAGQTMSKLESKDLPKGSEMLEDTGSQERALCADTSADSPCQVLDETFSASNKEEPARTELQQYMEDNTHLPLPRDSAPCLEADMKQEMSESVPSHTDASSGKTHKFAEVSVNSLCNETDSIEKVYNQNEGSGRDQEDENSLNRFEAASETKIEPCCVDSTADIQQHERSAESSVASMKESLPSAKISSQSDDVNNNINSINATRSDTGSEEMSSIPCLDAGMTKQLTDGIPSHREARTEDPQLSSSSADSKIMENISHSLNEDTYAPTDSSTTPIPKPNRKDNTRSSQRWKASRTENQACSSSYSDNPSADDSNASIEEYSKTELPIQSEDIHNLSNNRSSEISEVVSSNNSIPHLHKKEEFQATSEKEPNQNLIETVDDFESNQQNIRRKESGPISDESFGVEELSDHKDGGPSADSLSSRSDNQYQIPADGSRVSLEETLLKPELPGEDTHKSRNSMSNKIKKESKDSLTHPETHKHEKVPNEELQQVSIESFDDTNKPDPVVKVSKRISDKESCHISDESIGDEDNLSDQIKDDSPSAGQIMSPLESKDLPEVLEEAGIQERQVIDSSCADTSADNPGQGLDEVSSTSKEEVVKSESQQLMEDSYSTADSHNHVPSQKDSADFTSCLEAGTKEGVSESVLSHTDIRSEPSSRLSDTSVYSLCNEMDSIEQLYNQMESSNKSKGKDQEDKNLLQKFEATNKMDTVEPTCLDSTADILHQHSVESSFASLKESLLSAKMSSQTDDIKNKSNSISNVGSEETQKDSGDITPCLDAVMTKQLPDDVPSHRETIAENPRLSSSSVHSKTKEKLSFHSENQYQIPADGSDVPLEEPLLKTELPIEDIHHRSSNSSMSNEIKKESKDSMMHFEAHDQEKVPNEEPKQETFDDFVTDKQELAEYVSKRSISKEICDTSDESFGVEEISDQNKDGGPSAGQTMSQLESGDPANSSEMPEKIGSQQREVIHSLSADTSADNPCQVLDEVSSTSNKEELVKTESQQLMEDSYSTADSHNHLPSQKDSADFTSCLEAGAKEGVSEYVLLHTDIRSEPSSRLSDTSVYSLCNEMDSIEQLYNQMESSNKSKGKDQEDKNLLKKFEATNKMDTVEPTCLDSTADILHQHSVESSFASLKESLLSAKMSSQTDDIKNKSNSISNVGSEETQKDSGDITPCLDAVMTKQLPDDVPSHRETIAENPCLSSSSVHSKTKEKLSFHSENQYQIPADGSDVPLEETLLKTELPIEDIHHRSSNSSMSNEIKKESKGSMMHFEAHDQEKVPNEEPKQETFDDFVTDKQELAEHVSKRSISKEICDTSDESFGVEEISDQNKDGGPSAGQTMSQLESGDPANSSEMPEKIGSQQREVIHSLSADTSADNPCQVLDEVSSTSNKEELVKTESQQLMEDSYSTADSHNYLPSQKDSAGSISYLEAGVKGGASEMFPLHPDISSEKARPRSAESTVVDSLCKETDSIEKLHVQNEGMSKEWDQEDENSLQNIEATCETKIEPTCLDSTTDSHHQHSAESSVASLKESLLSAKMSSRTDDMNNKSNCISNVGSEETQQKDSSSFTPPCLDEDMTKQLPDNVPSHGDTRAEDPQLSSSSVDSTTRKKIAPIQNEEIYGTTDSSTTTIPKPDKEDNTRSSQRREATCKTEGQNPSFSCSDNPSSCESDASLKEALLKSKQPVDDTHNLSNSMSNEASEEIKNEPKNSVTDLKMEEVPNNFTSNEELKQVSTEEFDDSEIIQEDKLAQECKDTRRKKSGPISDESFEVEEFSDQNKDGSLSASQSMSQLESKHLEDTGSQEREVIDSLCVDTSSDNPCQLLDESSSVSNEEELVKTESQQLIEDSYNTDDSHNKHLSCVDSIPCLETGVSEGASEMVPLNTATSLGNTRPRLAESSVHSLCNETDSIERTLHQNESSNMSKERNQEDKNSLEKFEAPGMTEIESTCLDSTADILHQRSAKSAVASQTDDTHNKSNSISSVGSEETQKDTSSITSCLEANTTKHLPDNIPSEARTEETQQSSSSVDSKTKEKITLYQNEDTCSTADSSTTTKPDKEDNTRSSQRLEAAIQDSSSSHSDDPSAVAFDPEECLLNTGPPFDDLHDLSNSDVSDDIGNISKDSIRHVEAHEQEEVPDKFEKASNEEPKQLVTEIFDDLVTDKQDPVEYVTRRSSSKESCHISDEHFNVEEFSDYNIDGGPSAGQTMSQLESKELKKCEMLEETGTEETQVVDSLCADTSADNPGQVLDEGSSVSNEEELVKTESQQLMEDSYSTTDSHNHLSLHKTCIASIPCLGISKTFFIYLDRSSNNPMQRSDESCVNSQCNKTDSTEKQHNRHKSNYVTNGSSVKRGGINSLRSDNLYQTSAKKRAISKKELPLSTESQNWNEDVQGTHDNISSVTSEGIRKTRDNSVAPCLEADIEKESPKILPRGATDSAVKSKASSLIDAENSEKEIAINGDGELAFGVCTGENFRETSAQGKPNAKAMCLTLTDNVPNKHSDTWGAKLGKTKLKSGEQQAVPTCHGSAKTKYTERKGKSQTPVLPSQIWADSSLVSISESRASNWNISCSGAAINSIGMEMEGFQEGSEEESLQNQEEPGKRRNIEVLSIYSENGCLSKTQSSTAIHGNSSQNPQEILSNDMHVGLSTSESQSSISLPHKSTSIIDVLSEKSSEKNSRSSSALLPHILSQESTV